MIRLPASALRLWSGGAGAGMAFAAGNTVVAPRCRSCGWVLVACREAAV